MAVQTLAFIWCIRYTPSRRFPTTQIELKFKFVFHHTPTPFKVVELIMSIIMLSSTSRWFYLQKIFNVIRLTLSQMIYARIYVRFCFCLQNQRFVILAPVHYMKSTIMIPLIYQINYNFNLYRKLTEITYHQHHHSKNVYKE